jgi:hypothetical protein
MKPLRKSIRRTIKARCVLASHTSFSSITIHDVHPIPQAVADAGVPNPDPAFFIDGTGNLTSGKCEAPDEESRDKYDKMHD